MKYKKTTTLVLLSIFIAVLTGCVAGQTEKQDTFQNSAQASSKKVCKTYTPTNSRIPVKTCRSEEEWGEIERTAQRRLDESTKPQTNNPNGE